MARNSVAFKELHTDLFFYMENTKTFPTLTFADKEETPVKLRGKVLLFKADKAKDKKKKVVLAIMVVEQLGGLFEPTFTVHAYKDRKDRKVTIIFHGPVKLSDEEVDLVLHGLEDFIKNYKEGKNG